MTVAIVLIIVVVVAIAGYYVLSGMGSGQNSNSNSTSPVQSIVKVVSGTGSSSALNFSPASMTVVVGVNNTITWENSDSVAHTVTFTSAPSGVSASALTDPNNLAAGGTYTVTLTTPGTYQYHCTIHSWMTATITVLQKA